MFLIIYCILKLTENMMFRIRSLSKSFSYFERFPRRTKSQPRSEIILPTWPKRFVLVFLCSNPDRFLRYEITSETTIPKLLKETVPKLTVWKSSNLLGMKLEKNDVLFAFNMNKALLGFN